MANKNIVEVLVQPQVPKVLDNQNIFVYMPLATNKSPGIVKPDETDFIIGENGTLQFNWSGTRYEKWADVFNDIIKLQNSINQVELNREQLFDDADKVEGKDTIKRKVDILSRDMVTAGDLISSIESNILVQKSNIATNAANIKTNTDSITALKSQLSAGILNKVIATSLDNIPAGKAKSTTTFYLIGPLTDSEATNYYNEYIYVTTPTAHYELIGNTKVDLSGYLTEDEADGKYLKATVNDKGEGEAQTAILYNPADTTVRSKVGGISAGTDLTTLYKDEQSGIQLKTLFDKIFGYSPIELSTATTYGYGNKSFLSALQYITFDNVSYVRSLDSVSSAYINNISLYFDNYDNNMSEEYTQGYPKIRITEKIGQNERKIVDDISITSSNFIVNFGDNKVSLLLANELTIYELLSATTSVVKGRIKFDDLYYFHIYMQKASDEAYSDSPFDFGEFYTKIDGEPLKWVCNHPDGLLSTRTLYIDLQKGVLFDEIKDSNGLDYIDCFDTTDNRDGTIRYTLRTPVSIDKFTLYFKIKKGTI